MKKLKLSSTDKRLFGVCGGLANYFDIDSTIIRILFFVWGCCGCGLLAYLLAALFMPKE